MNMRILSLSSLLLLATSVIHGSQAFDRKNFLNQKLQSLSKAHYDNHNAWLNAHNEMLYSGKTKEGKDLQEAINKKLRPTQESYEAFVQTEEYRKNVAPLWIDSYRHWFMHVNVEWLLQGNTPAETAKKQKAHLELIQSGSDYNKDVLAQANIEAEKDFNVLMQKIEQAEKKR